MNLLLTLTSFLIFFSFSFLPAQVHAAANTYYVTQNGNGARSGNGLSNAWSVSDFNNSANWSTNDNAGKIDPGDTVYFSGTITSQIIIPGSGSASGSITLDGYEVGNCDPINSECTSSALVNGSNYYGIAATSPRSYIVVQDFRVKNSNEGIYFSGNSHHILIRRNYTYHNPYHGIKFPGDEGSSSGEIKYIIVGGALGDGNYVQDAGNADGNGWMMNYNVNHLLISYNKFLSTSFGNEGLTNNSSSNILVEKNDMSNQTDLGTGDGQGIQTKTEISKSASNIIYRFNNIHDCEQLGIQVINHQSNVYLYGNRLYNNSIGIGINKQLLDMGNIYAWANLSISNRRRGIDLANYADPGSMSYVGIFNNTVVGNGTSPEDYTDSGFRHETGSNVQVANNIFANNLTQGGQNQEIWNGLSGVTLSDNLYHNDGSSVVLTGISQESDSYDGDPKFSGRGSYTLQSDSPAIDTGTSKSGCFSVNLSNGDSWFETYSGYSTVSVCYDEALDPNGTNWGTVPPTVRTVKQGSYGSWDRGAYVYTGSASSTISSPSGLKIMPSN